MSRISFADAPFRSIAIAAMFLLSCGVATTRATVFPVTNTNDSGQGSLRQAVLDSNQTPGPNVIEFDLPAGATPNVIQPTGQFLPPLKGPVVVRVKGAASVVLDGSKLIRPRTPDDCPGATFAYNTQTNQWESSHVAGTGANVRGYYGAGLAIHDSHDVEISGFEIRNFCAGVAGVRSHDVYIHDMKIVDNHGAAGVIFTGDDGNAMATPLSYNNKLMNSVLLDNGDGFEFTRGTHDSLLQGTTITLTQPLPIDGNAIEFAYAGDNNAVIGNTFTKYVDTAVTVGGANQTIRDNKFLANKGAGLRASGNNLLILGNTFSDNGGDALAVSGAGSRVIDNVVSSNGGRGIVVGSLGVTLTRNSVYNNAHLGIDLATPAAGGASAANAGPQPPVAPVVLPETPAIDATSKWSVTGLVLNGSLTSKPNQTYAIEIFISREADRHPGDEHGWGEGQTYIGTASATTDAAGQGTFSLMVKVPDIFGDGQVTGLVTATATDAAGSTSKFSRSLMLTKGK